MGFDEDGCNADRHRRPGQNLDEMALATGSRSPPTRLLDRVGGIEHDRKPGACEIGMARMSDTRALYPKLARRSHSRRRQ